MLTRHPFVLVVLLLVVPVLIGCQQSKPSIHGTVTYEGVPISRGQITFAPADGRGVARSAPIEAGKYTIENVPPGKKIVQIIGVKQIQFAKTHAEMAAAAKRGAPAAPETADEVPTYAEGNNQAIETIQGSQERNFNLKRPQGGAS